MVALPIKMIILDLLKRVQVSENYKRFKEGYEKKAILRFGVYKENPNKKPDSRKI